MRMKFNKLEFEVEDSGSVDLGFFLKIYSSYGKGEKLIEQIKTDHEIVDILITCIEEDGWDREIPYNIAWCS